jgi:hypothetical protein
VDAVDALAQATPSEILNEMRLQRRFVPVLRFGCTEIRYSTLAPLAKRMATSAVRRA